MILPPPSEGVYDQDPGERDASPDEREQRWYLPEPDPGDQVSHHRDEIQETDGQRGRHARERVGVGRIGYGGREDTQVDHRERGPDRGHCYLRDQSRQEDEREEGAGPHGVGGERQRAVLLQIGLLEHEVDARREGPEQDQERLGREAEALSLSGGDQGSAAEADRHTHPAEQPQSLAEEQHGRIDEHARRARRDHEFPVVEGHMIDREGEKPGQKDRREVAPLGQRHARGEGERPEDHGGHGEPEEGDLAWPINVQPCSYTGERRGPEDDGGGERQRHGGVEPGPLHHHILNDPPGRTGGTARPRSLYSGCYRENQELGENHGYHRHQAQEPHHTRGARSRAGEILPQGHGLLQRGPEQAHSRGRPLLDRDDALQLQPPPLGRESESRHQGGWRHADGAQHHLHLRRHNDGDAGDEDLPRQPRFDRRLYRARGARPHVRRYGDDRRLRQDDPGRRDGPREARGARHHRVFRLHSTRPLQRTRRNDSGRLRGRRCQRRG